MARVIGRKDMLGARFEAVLQMRLLSMRIICTLETHKLHHSLNDLNNIQFGYPISSLVFPKHRPGTTVTRMARTAFPALPLSTTRHPRIRGVDAL